MQTVLNRTIKTLPVLLFFLALIPAFSACNDGLPENAVARVDDRIVTREWFDKTVERGRAQYGPKFAGDDVARQRLVQQKVMDEVAVLEAEKFHLEASDEEIDEQVQKIKDQSGSEEQFQASLAESGVSMDEFRENVRRWILATKLRAEVLKGMPQPTDEEAFQFYSQNKQLFMNKSYEEVKPMVKAQMIEATGGREKYYMVWLGKVMTDHKIIYAEGYQPTEEPGGQTSTTPVATPAP